MSAEQKSVETKKFEDCKKCESKNCVVTDKVAKIEEKEIEDTVNGGTKVIEVIKYKLQERKFTRGGKERTIKFPVPDMKTRKRCIVCGVKN